VSAPGAQFELTRPEALYDDLTKICRYMPQLEQALASGKGAGGKSLTDGERAYCTEILSEATCTISADAISKSASSAAATQEATL
jgi:hypothetical protein